MIMNHKMNTEKLEIKFEKEETEKKKRRKG